MICIVRRKWIASLVGVLGCCGALLPALGLADSVATTGNATSITTSRAVLNGVIDPTYSDNDWFFEYSTSADFSSGNKITKPVAVGSGPQAVSAKVTGLTPGTVYFYRVGVGAAPDTTQGPVYHFGDTASFTTHTAGAVKRYGVASLLGRVLKLSGGRVRFTMVCRGAAGSTCSALAGVIARSHGKLVSCGTGRFVATAAHRHTVVVKPSAGCRAAVARARHRRLTAAFIAVFSTHQAKLADRVTLAG
jgi:hypothetical protein